ncbi:putative glutaredoxin [Emiliania huxleyi CCMP1516]|uniref:Glutaredoxin domain-containing protein n=2 Tax=Emiliania huxleyi TaxID=2903 RepID=A0A0D3HXA3_EMIH1|nr:putative glutaredoxin [Emiliania huxleyi CCMP1516]EOD03638.1 putative glutaredoxin [Emiliania huxleyi CCMP1516]|eukprot:XP_005756067.1 putative glutaredoxin [Emiliania huxleyi CCMP1516]
MLPRSTGLARAGLAPARTGLLLMVAKQPAVSAFPALTAAGVATASDGSDDLEQKIAATVAAHPVVVYSKSRCGYSARTKSLFDSLGVEYHAVELDKAADGAAMQTALARLTKQRTVPNVFVRGSHLGGNDATQAAALSGELQKMLGLTS